jgi:alginate O-acetyltransferase complex protein AlgJ
MTRHPHDDLTREDVAKIEIGHTDVSRARAAVLAGLFVATLATVPVAQHVRDIRAYDAGRRDSPVPQCYEIVSAVPRAVERAKQSPRGFPWNAIEANNQVLLPAIDRYEDALEGESLLAEHLLPRGQALLARIGLGNEKAYVGRDGWLFYRPSVDYLTAPGFLEPVYLRKRSERPNEWTPAPQPDPRPAVLQFHRQLAERGIELFLVPAPAKPMIHPEKLSIRYAGRDEVLQNPSYDRFVREMRSAGVRVFEPAGVLMRLRRETHRPQYLATDTHWRPEAMQRVAAELARFIEADAPLPAAPSPGYRRLERQVENIGDIARMLELPDDQTLYPPQTVTVREVYAADDTSWRADPSADVLVLGDSFSNVYSLDAMGWGFAGGFVEQLSVELDRPLDRIVRNDDGAHATRQALRRELARGRDRLAGKRLVIWQFAVRELAVGDWKLLDMTLGEPRESDSIAPAPGEEMIVTGTVAAVSPVPRPGSVVYRDHVVTLHLVDVTGRDGNVQDGQAVVYMLSMRDNEWTPAARYRVGQEVTLRLRSWQDVRAKYEGINRSELDDIMLELEPNGWGEAVQ